MIALDCRIARILRTRLQQLCRRRQDSCPVFTRVNHPQSLDSLSVLTTEEPRIVSFWTRLFPQCDANCPAVVRGQRASVFYDEQGGDCELSGAPSLRDSTFQVSTRPSGGSPCVPKIIPQAGHSNGTNPQFLPD